MPSSHLSMPAHTCHTLVSEDLTYDTKQFTLVSIEPLLVEFKAGKASSRVDTMYKRLMQPQHTLAQLYQQVLGLYQVEVGFVGEDVKQLHQAGMVQLPQQLDLPQGSHVDALRALHCVGLVKHVLGAVQSRAGAQAWHACR